MYKSFDMAYLKGKYVVQLCALNAFLFLSGCVGGEKWVFPFETAMVEYDISGDFTGRERLYIDGDMEARESVTITVFDGEVYSTKSRIVNRDGQQYYFYEGVKADGTKENEHYEVMKAMNFEDRRDYYLRQVLLQGAVFNRVGKDTVLERECDVYKVSFGEVCVWDNLILKQKVDLMGVKTEMIARDLRLDKYVEESVFEVE